MTNLENQIMDKLVEAHNLFVLLPTQHPDDLKEWCSQMHELQRMGDVTGCCTNR